MVRTSVFAIVLGLLGFASALPTVGTRTDETTAKKVMPFGASIVEVTCWRAFLQKRLKAVYVDNFNFVGSMSGPASCTLNGVDVPFDKDNEGHSGKRVTDYAKDGNLVGWLESAKPDIIIMHVGTNDVIAKIDTADIINAYGVVLGQMRASKPEMVLILSKLIPIDPKLYGQDVSDGITKLNTAMDDFVKKNSTPKSPITLVDMTGFDYKTMTKEGEHPNEAGDVFMSDRFLEPVKNALEDK